MHKAAGNHQKDKPVYFLKLESTKSLISVLCENLTSDKINELEPVNTVNSFTERQGTYVVKPLVYAYAMWISPAFHLAVINAYDALVMEQLQPANKLPSNPKILAGKFWITEEEWQAAFVIFACPMT